MPHTHHRRPIWFSVTTSMFMLMSCSEQSEQTQGSPCKEIFGVFAIDDWQKLATGPLVESLRGAPGTQSRAPARSLLKGFENCEFVQMKLAQHMPAGGILTYQCNAQEPVAQSDDLLAEAKAFAAGWKLCFSGWKEIADFHYFDSRDHSKGALARVRYSKNEQSVTFMSVIQREKAKPNTIELTKFMMR